MQSPLVAKRTATATSTTYSWYEVFTRIFRFGKSNTFFFLIRKRFTYYCIKKKGLKKHTTHFYRAPKEIDLTQPKLDHPSKRPLISILHKSKQPISTQLMTEEVALRLRCCLDGAFPTVGKSSSIVSASDAVRLPSKSLSKASNSETMALMDPWCSSYAA